MRLNNNCILKKSLLGGTLTCLLVMCICLSGCRQPVITVEGDIMKEKSEKKSSELPVPQLGEAKTDEMVYRKEDDSNLIDIGCCAILIPEGFHRDEEVSGMYVSDLYPLDSSNIYYSVVEDREVGAVDENLTVKDFEEALEASYKAQGQETDIIVDEFSKEFIEDVPCFKVRSHFNVGERDIQQLSYIVMATKTHIITYTQVSDDELMSDFLVEEGQIKLVREISQA